MRKNRKWKPVGLVFIFAVSVFFGVFSIHGAEVATGTTVSGHISVDTTWDIAGSPYIVMNDVVVDPGITLTIDPGVEVKFDPAGTHGYLSIFVEGTLYAIGQANKFINFTSNSMTPSYDWNAVQINATGTADIENCSFSYGEGLILISSTGQIVRNNVFPHRAMIITRTPGHNISNNTFSYNGGISLSSGNNTAIGNFLSRSSIWLNVGGNVVSGNTLTSGYDDILPGIMVDSDNNTIANNTVEDINGEAIRVRGSGNEISFNSIASSQTGIDLSVSFHNNSAIRNEISDCGFAITVLASDDNRIIQNDMEGGTYGIRVAAGDRNLIVGNRISRASLYGIRMESSRGNLIHHNVFMDNAIQAEDDESSNSWDDGYPSGGNYWSDYTGNDSYQGPNQILPGSDGIGDVAYPVNPNGTDRYPLMEPTTWGVPPRNVNAHLSGLNYENVTITWNLSWNDGQRANDVIAYEIFRSSVYDKRRTGYLLVNSVPNQTTEFVDVLAGEGNPSNYFYYVCAINATSNRSCSEGQAGKFTRHLTEGERLLSIPLAQSDERIETVLQTVSFDKSWFYDPISEDWISFVESKPYAKGLVNLNHTMGFWVNVTEGSNFTVAGRVVMEAVIPLSLGWNLIGYPSFESEPLSDLRKGTPISRVERFDIGNDPYHLIAMEDVDRFQPGEGYWVLSSSEGIFRFRS